MKQTNRIIDDQEYETTWPVDCASRLDHVPPDVPTSLETVHPDVFVPMGCAWSPVRTPPHTGARANNWNTDACSERDKSFRYNLPDQNVANSDSEQARARRWNRAKQLRTVGY